MSRSQQKCFIAASAAHGLMLVILLVGPAFFLSDDKPEELPTIEIIDLSNVIITDAKVFSGGSPQAAQPPPPRQEQRILPAPDPVPVRQPDPPKPEPVPQKPVETPKPAPVKHTPKINTKMVIKKQEPVSRPTTPASNPAQEFTKAAERIQKNLSPSTTVTFEGPGGVAVVNYTQLVRSRYMNAWIEPDDTASNRATTKVTVTIARNGRVISARIVHPSGDAMVDASVRRTLDRVDFIAPFPEGVSEQERTFNINFTIQATRLSG